MGKFQRHPSYAYRQCLLRRKNGAIQLELLDDDFLQDLAAQEAAPEENRQYGNSGHINGRTAVACWVLSRHTGANNALFRPRLRFMPFFPEKH